MRFDARILNCLILEISVSNSLAAVSPWLLWSVMAYASKSGKSGNWIYVPFVQPNKSTETESYVRLRIQLEPKHSEDLKAKFIHDDTFKTKF